MTLERSITIMGEIIDIEREREGRRRAALDRLMTICRLALRCRTRDQLTAAQSRLSVYVLAAICSAVTPINAGGPSVAPTNLSRVPPE